MDNVAVSKRNQRRENKENAKPVPGSKPLIRGAKTTSTAPFQTKSDNQMGALPKAGLLKAQNKQLDSKSASARGQKCVTSVQRNGKGAAAPVPKHSRAVLTEQAVKDRKVTQGALKPLAATSSKFAPKPPASMPVAKPALGMYKGKPVQSKIGSIWKQSATVPRMDSKPVAPKREAQRCEYVPAVRHMVSKPVASSTLSQYRSRTETDEERRAKLAEWMASKGKTFKRPAMTTAVPAKRKVSAKPGAVKAQSQAAQQHNPEPLPSVKANGLPPAAPAPAPTPAPAPDPCATTQGAESEAPMIRNTSIELLEVSDGDLAADPGGNIDDIVVNLCDALEAMTPPSKCNSAFSEETSVCNDVDKEAQVKVEAKEELNGEMTEDVEHVKLEQVKAEAEDGDEQDVELDEDDDDDDNDDDCVETTPQMEDASVVKYNVKTTPYLQSFKRTLEDEASASASRRKSNIKDLKYLTPVRRSCRIQRKSSVLPSMLLDHDPCVSSLAELVKLDEDSNAYIYRKNTALLEDLPDRSSL